MPQASRFLAVCPEKGGLPVFFTGSVKFSKVSRFFPRGAGAALGRGRKT
jgi:hypothetical protein